MNKRYLFQITLIWRVLQPSFNKHLPVYRLTGICWYSTIGSAIDLQSISRGFESLCQPVELMAHVFIRRLKEAPTFDAGHVKNVVEGDTGYSGTICDMSSSHNNGYSRWQPGKTGNLSGYGGIGRRKGLKIPRHYYHTGSIHVIRIKPMWWNWKTRLT